MRGVGVENAQACAVIEDGAGANVLDDRKDNMLVKTGKEGDFGR